MKNIHILIVLNSLFINMYGQNFEWAKREGLYEYDYGYGIANDNAGNVYVAGKYEMKANFSGTILPQQGNHDIYVAKYSQSGALIWIRTAGGYDGDYARALACDGTDYVYIAGEIQGSGALIKFPGSAITLTCRGNNDAFFAKYDLNGNLLWAKQAGGTGNDEAQSITYDNSGNVYVAGFYSNGAVFGTSPVSGKGGYDMFVAKYDKNGVFQWVRTGGGPGRDEAKSIKCDAAGNVYVCGMYKNGAVFGSQTLTSPNGYFNAFLAKYTPDGTLAWVKTGGGNYDDLAWSLTIDNNNKIYVTGEFNAHALFSGVSLITTGSADIFVACYNASGTIEWIKKAGGNSLDRARGIGTDGTNIYITGQFAMSANFGPYTVTGVDNSEIFIAKLNNDGFFQWATSVSGPVDLEENLGYESGTEICAEVSGNVYVTGALLNGGKFGSASLNAYSRTDAFITKISQNAGSVCTSTGTISREFWADVSGTSVNNIPVNTVPATISLLTEFKSPSNVAEDYGQRIRGYVCPPYSGNYIFWIASDDNSELWLSTNDNPANKQKIASVSGWTASKEWTKYPSQQSDPINLIAGQKYYIEALHKEGSQGDNCAVGWQLPTGVFERPVPGIRLSPYAIPLTATITSPLNNSSFGVGTSVTIQANVAGGTGTIQKVEFFAGTTKLGEDLTSPYSFTWNNVTEGNYQLSVKTTDSDNDNAVSSNVTIYVSPKISCSATGTISQEIWNNVIGTSVSAIPLNTAPGSTVQLSVFKSVSNMGDNYGQRIRGYVCPPATGNYIFWIASDDNSELWLSTNDNPANKQKIASVSGWTASTEWTKYPGQQSASINLVAGQKYYIEALHKEGGQGDNCAVGWQLPNGTFERPVPGIRLSPYAIPLTATITSPLNNTSFGVGTSVTIQANVAGGTGTIQKVEFFAGTTKLGEDLTSPYSFTWNNIVEGNYQLSVKAIDSGNNNAVSANVTIYVSPIISCSATGSISQEIWNNVIGTSVSAIPLNTAPGSTVQLSVFKSTSNMGDNYGQRISGYVCPPATGNYIFWIASDDNSELWLSTDDNPVNKQKIASVSGWTASTEWTKYPGQQSASINLVAGQKYYIEALHKEGGQGDNCAVGWQLPNGTFERPIPGNRLSPFEISTPTPLEELISPGSNWKYLDDGTNQGTAWKAPAFSDATWKTGNAELGYGDGDETTIISYGPSSTNKYITTYFRKTFNITDTSPVSGLELSLIRDDGAVVYINGIEVYRNNLPSGTIYYNTLAPTYIDGANESTYVIANLSASALVDGTNVIAVEIHQNAGTSSDISFNLKLSSLSGLKIMNNQVPEDSIQLNSVSDEMVEMIVYPNPNTGKFNLEFCIDGLDDKPVLIEITNAFGQVVYNKTPQRINGCINEAIELESDLPTGIYILKVSIDGKTQTAKMLLTK